MNETEKMARFLELATNKRIANANQGKVVNRCRQKCSILVFCLIIPLLCFFAFTDQSKWVNIGFFAGIIILWLIAYYFLSMEKGTVPNYFKNQFGKKMSLYNYKLEMMYLYLLLEGHISPYHSNLAFYDSVLSKTIEAKEGANISSNIHVPFAVSTLIFALFAFVVSNADLGLTKVRAAAIALTISIFIFCIYFFVCFLIQRSAEPYILLHSIICDLRIKDSIKFKKGSHCSNELHLHVSIDTVDKGSK